MKKLPIYFFNQDINFTLKHKNKIRHWLNQAVIAETYQLSTLNFIFCNDAFLLKINQEYLNHDTLTDIITFDNSVEKGKVTADLYISVDRVKENSKIFKTKFYTELQRVIIHGTLHLLGFDDKSAKAKKLMTFKEDYYLKQTSI